MENNPQQVEIQMQEQDEPDEVGKYCIFTVPEFVRKENEECYLPLVVSICPVFYKDPKLQGTQKLKEYYLKCFIEHPHNAFQSLDPYINFVREHESEIRECYQHHICLESEEFIHMMVLDAAFLIFSFMVDYGTDYRHSKDAKLEISWLRSFIARDVSFLEENQLPFIVHKGIYDIAFGAASPHISFTKLALLYLRWEGTNFPSLKAIEYINEGKKITDASSIKQLVHLQRKCCCLAYFARKDDDWEVELPYVSLGIYSAKQLSDDAGVKFEIKQSDNPFDITFDNGVLKIPKVQVDDKIETVFRNMLFFEQCHGYKDTYFTDYIYFLDQLINTVEDIQILQQNGILENLLGSDKVAADLFNKLTKYTFTSNNYAFYNLSKDLKGYASARRNKWKTILRKRYFNHPWAVISVIAASLLFILTLLQTISCFIFH